MKYIMMIIGSIIIALTILIVVLGGVFSIEALNAISVFFGVGLALLITGIMKTNKK